MAIQTTELDLASLGADSCKDCVQSLLLEMTGVKKVTLKDCGCHLNIAYDAQRSTPTQLQTLLLAAQQKLIPAIRHEKLQLTGVDCAECSRTLERGIQNLPGVLHAQVNFANAQALIAYNRERCTPAQITRCVRELGFGIQGEQASHQHIGCACGEEHTHEEHAIQSTPSRLLALWQRVQLWFPTAAAASFWVIGFLLPYLNAPTLASTICFILAIIIGGYRVARSGYFALVRSRTLDINILMTIAVIGAGIIGQWEEGAAVVILFSLGEMLEESSMNRVRKSLHALMDLAPREATLRTSAGERRVPVEQLQPGDTILIRPGERIPADGLVSAGMTLVNQAPITGESIPVEKLTGDEVYAGTINQHGSLEVQVTKYAQDSTLAKIITLVQEAQGSRAPIQRFIDRFAHYYTPAIAIFAVLLAVIPPVVLQEPFVTWLYRALVLLVIACPCALVISTPVAIVSAVSRASRAGILIKGGAFLEILSSLKAIAFDKTGTITQGRPAVTDVEPLSDLSEEQLLQLAAAVEIHSEHPLASAILEEAKARELNWNEPEAFQALPGQGAQALVEQQTILVGKPALFAPLEPTIEQRVIALEEAGKTVLIVGVEKQPAGLIAVADQLRPEAAEALQDLYQSGIAATTMLTGDNERTARAVARAVGVTDVAANLLPEQKLKAIVQLNERYQRVAMVGDGINDAPALAKASVGIAMGATGSDTALEAADVALMTDDLRKLPFLLRLSRATMRTIRVNITFSLVIKAVFLLLTIAGIANLWLAILADTGAALLVIAHSLLLLRSRS